jgi:hypothetical protein
LQRKRALIEAHDLAPASQYQIIIGYIRPNKGVDQRRDFLSSRALSAIFFLSVVSNRLRGYSLAANSMSPMRQSGLCHTVATLSSIPF